MLCHKKKKKIEILQIFKTEIYIQITEKHSIDYRMQNAVSLSHRKTAQVAFKQKISQK